MRVKSIEPPVLQEAEWLSPDGHPTTWHRVWNGGAWVDVETPEDTGEDDGGQTKQQQEELRVPLGALAAEERVRDDGQSAAESGEGTERTEDKDLDDRSNLTDAP